MDVLGPDVPHQVNVTFKASGPVRIRQRRNSRNDVWRQALLSPSWLRGKSFGEISPKLAETVLLHAHRGNRSWIIPVVARWVINNSDTLKKKCPYLLLRSKCPYLLLECCSFTRKTKRVNAAPKPRNLCRIIGYYTCEQRHHAD